MYSFPFESFVSSKLFIFNFIAIQGDISKKNYFLSEVIFFIIPDDLSTNVDDFIEFIGFASVHSNKITHLVRDFRTILNCKQRHTDCDQLILCDSVGAGGAYE